MPSRQGCYLTSIRTQYELAVSKKCVRILAILEFSSEI